MLKQDVVERQKINTRDSNVVPHRSTNLARWCLTSLSRREAVLSSLYGRSWYYTPLTTISHNCWHFRSFFCGSPLVNGPLHHAFTTNSASPAFQAMEWSQLSGATMPTTRSIMCLTCGAKRCLNNAFQIVRVKKANLEYTVSRDLRGIKHSRDG